MAASNSKYGFPMLGWPSSVSVRKWCRGAGRMEELDGILARAKASGMTDKECWRTALAEMELDKGVDKTELHSSIGFTKPEEERLNKLANLVISRKGKPEEVVTFVMRMLDVTIARIPVEEIPDPSAITLLRWARESSENKRDFIMGIFPKMVTTKQQTEGTGLLSDDSRSSQRAIDAFMSSMGGV